METGQTDERHTVDGLRREIEELSASRTRLAQAADAERRVIERALHEGVQQDLAGLAANLEVAAGLVDSDPATAKPLLEELQREALRALTEIRELAARVFPPLLGAGGLVPELRAAAARAQAPSEIEVAVEGTVPSEIAAAVYFCAADVFERAPAGTSAAVRVTSDEGTLLFEISADADLGTERLAPHDHVEALGGNVSITSGGDRTTVAGSLPLGP